jgi:hypothetical protein
VANITPMTQLVVAQTLAADPAAAYTSFSTATQAALTPAAVQAAQVKVVNVLKSNGIDTSAQGNLITAPLVAVQGASSGNALGQLVGQLSSQLANSGVSIAQFTSATVVQSNGASSSSSSTVSVPAEVLLQASTASCPALRSAKYRVLLSQRGNNLATDGTEVISYDAGTQTFTLSDGSKVVLTATPGSPCRFSGDSGTDMTVSQAGVVAFKSGQGSLGIGFPVQSIALAELAGTWNAMGLVSDGSATAPKYSPIAFTFTQDSVGNRSAISVCSDLKTCAPGTGTHKLVARADGGFDSTTPGESASFVAAYRAGNGDLMMVQVDGDGSLYALTQQRTVTLPTVGQVNNSWDVGTSNVLAGQPITDGANTITSVDAATQSFQRSNVTDFTTNVTRPELVFVNVISGGLARTGYRWRKGETVTNSAGASVNVPEWVGLSLRGMGMNVVAQPSSTSNPYKFSVTKP